MRNPRSTSRTGEIRIFDSTGKVERVIAFDDAIGDCDGGEETAPDLMIPLLSDSSQVVNRD